MTELSNQEMIDSVNSDLSTDTASTASGDIGTESSVNDQSKTKEELMYEYSALGKTIKEPISMILKRASMGYDYAQKMHQMKQLNDRIAQLESENKNLGPYKQYDDYARSNPAWREHLMQTWENRHQTSDPNISADDPYAQRFNQLMKTFEDKLNPISEKVNQFDKFINETQYQKTISGIQSEIDKVKTEFQGLGIDFETPDEMGQDLTFKVLAHMKDNNLPSFKTAFKDFYFDQIRELERQKVNSNTANELQKRQKQGIVNVSSTSNKKSQSPDFKNLNYDQLAALAAQDFKGKN